jgi:hypothetical protein
VFGGQVNGSCNDLFTVNNESELNPCIVSQFYDPARDDNQNIYTQPLLLTNALSAHQSYIDIYQFDSNVTLVKIDLSVNLQAVLGQFWRFYLYSIFAYLVLIVQVYHLQVVFKSRATVVSYPQFIVVLGDFNSLLSFTIHLLTSLLLSFITFILQSFNSSFLHNDITELTDYQISFGPAIVLFMYWSAFLIVNMTFLAVLACKIPLTFIKPNSFNCKAVTNLILWIVHFVLTLVLLIFSSALAICSIILFKAARLFYNHVQIKAANNHNIKITKKLQHIEVDLVLTLVLAALNIPGLITWLGLIPVVGPKPFFMSNTGDLGLVTASLCIFLHVLDTVTLVRGHFQAYEFKFKVVKIVSWFFVVLVALNCLFCFFYSVLRLYRLQYFILAHMFQLFLVNNLEFLVSLASRRVCSSSSSSSSKQRAEEEEVIQPDEAIQTINVDEPEPSEYL